MDNHNKSLEQGFGLSVVSLTTGPGSGRTCDGCGHSIECGQTECRTSNDAQSSAASLRFHQWCYYAKFASNR